MVFPLDKAYRALNNRRMEIDRGMTGLPPDDSCRDELWKTLQPVMDELRKVVIGLTNSQPADLSELQAKAAILAALLRAEDDGGGPIIPEAERVALALSLTNDVARLPVYGAAPRSATPRREWRA
jgi:hypothetical protein